MKILPSRSLYPSNSWALALSLPNQVLLSYLSNFFLPLRPAVVSYSFEQPRGKRDDGEEFRGMKWVSLSRSFVVLHLNHPGYGSSGNSWLWWIIKLEVDGIADYISGEWSNDRQWKSRIEALRNTQFDACYTDDFFVWRLLFGVTTFSSIYYKS